MRRIWRSKPNAHLNREISNYGCRGAVRQQYAATPLDKTLKKYGKCPAADPASEHW
jgi:hypothetical protein